MNKAELVTAMADEMDTAKNVAEKALDALSKVFQRQLVKGESLSVPGVGKFAVIQRAARTGWNVKAGKKMEIPAKKAVQFKATKTLADAVNE